MTEENQNKGRMRSLLTTVGKRISNLDAGVAEVKMLHSFMVELESIIRTFADTAHEGIVLVQDNKYIWINKAGCDISGYTEQEIFNLNLEQSILPEDRDKLRARMGLLLAGDIADMPAEWRILRKDRTVRYINAFSYRVKFMEKPAILVLFYDMTESKKTNDELMMRAQILDSVNDSVILTDMAGKIVYVNDAVSDRTGYTKKELLGMDIRKLSPPERSNLFDIRLRQYSEHKESRYSTVTMFKDGIKVPVEVRGSIIRQGGKQFLLAVVREVKKSDTENGSNNSAKKGKQ
jgi:PAS domain S-box-containing protein